MESIGSYLPLELYSRNKDILYPHSLLLNSGRNALEYIIKTHRVEKLYIPYLHCDSIIAPLVRNGVQFEFYSIDKNHLPVWDYNSLKEGEYFLYIDYFGVRNSVTKYLIDKINHLIIDNTQAFFSSPLPNIPTFYSTRKFFGVSDGAILCNVEDTIDLKQDRSADRMRHLLLRVENSSEAGYSSYQEVEKIIETLPLMKMSELTTKILLSIDYNYHIKVRRENFRYLHNSLEKFNRLKFSNIEETNAPLAYPLWIDDGPSLRAILKENRVFTPIYWSSILDSTPEGYIERDMALNTIPIPIDPRYKTDHLKRVIDLIHKFYGS